MKKADGVKRARSAVRRVAGLPLTVFTAQPTSSSSRYRLSTDVSAIRSIAGSAGSASLACSVSHREEGRQRDFAGVVYGFSSLDTAAAEPFRLNGNAAGGRSCLLNAYCLNARGMPGHETGKSVKQHRYYLPESLVRPIFKDDPAASRPSGL
jgi:hypothetical protein